AREIVDDAELPHRPRWIERRRDQPRDERLELARPRFPRQPHAHHMAIEIEGRIALPKRSGCGFDGALAKATEDQETFADDLPEPLERNFFAKQQDAANHH